MDFALIAPQCGLYSQLSEIAVLRSNFISLPVPPVTIVRQHPDIHMDSWQHRNLDSILLDVSSEFESP